MESMFDYDEHTIEQPQGKRCPYSVHCSSTCALYSDTYGKCAFLLQAEAAVKSASALEKIADSTEERLLGL